MATKKQPPKGVVYSLETIETVKGDYLQIVSESNFIVRIDGEFRGPYSPEVRKMVIRLGRKDKQIEVMSNGPVKLHQWDSAEKNSLVPVEVPLDREPTLTELVQSMIRQEISHAAEEDGKLSFADFDNLGDEDDIEDDFPHSPYEVLDMQEDAPISQPSAQSAPNPKGSQDEPPAKATGSQDEPPAKAPETPVEDPPPPSPS